MGRHQYGQGAVGPRALESRDDIPRPSTHEQGPDLGEKGAEAPVPMRRIGCGKPREIVVFAGKKAVEADGEEDPGACRHAG